MLLVPEMEIMMVFIQIQIKTPKLNSIITHYCETYLKKSNGQRAAQHRTSISELEKLKT